MPHIPPPPSNLLQTIIYSNGFSLGHDRPQEIISTALNNDLASSPPPPPVPPNQNLASRLLYACWLWIQTYASSHPMFQFLPCIHPFPPIHLASPSPDTFASYLLSLLAVMFWPLVTEPGKEPTTAGLLTNMKCVTFHWQCTHSFINISRTWFHP